MKKAFTMIELIFVIVIIGILASVAIPKLSATRTDAVINAEIVSLKQSVANLQGEYLAKGWQSGNHFSSTKCFRINMYKYAGHDYIGIESYDKNSNNMPLNSCSYSSEIRNKIYKAAKKTGLFKSKNRKFKIALSKSDITY